jgi:cytidine deaminase
MRLKTKAYVPYSKQPSSALFVAYNDNGTVGTFPGASEDNASYGGSARAETVSMRSARTAGYTQNVQLFVTVDDPTAPNPLDGESLQVLREFGADAPICLVSDNQVVFTSLDELLPDSFGPEAL